MKWVLSHKLYLFLPLALACLYFLVRLPNLTLQPIFADEAIYIRWAQVMRAEPSLRFVSLQDGKTPLFMWMMIPLFKLISDPLLAGRLLSVMAGFLTFVGMGTLGVLVFGRRVGLWALFLGSMTPFLVFFDRMALVDSLLAAYSLWSLITALLLVKYQRIDLAMVLGYFLGAGILTKTPGFFNLLVLPTTIFSIPWVKTKRELQVVKLFGLSLITCVITFFMYGILKLGPGIQNLSSRDQDYLRSPMEVLKTPWNPLLPHFSDLVNWLPKLLTPPVLLCILIGIILVVWRRNGRGITILLWSLIPMVLLMMFLQTFTARYILFQIPPLLVLGAWGIEWIVTMLSTKKYSYVMYSLIGLLLLAPLMTYFNVKLLTDPQNAPLPADERRGYFEDWTAGYGFPEIADYLKQHAQKELVVVGTEGFFGTLPDGLQIYLDKDRQVIVQGQRATVSAELRSTAKEHPTFFVANKSRYPVPAENLTLIKEYTKASNPKFPQDSILFYQVLPTK